MKRAMLFCFVYRLLAAAVIGMPLSLSVASVLGRHPRGDALVADSTWLLEAGRVLHPSLGVFAIHSIVLLVLASFGWLVPLATLMGAAAHGSFREALGRGLGRLPGLSLLLVAAWLAQAALAMGSIRLAAFTASRISSTRAADIVNLIGPLFALFLVWLLAVVHDVVRAHLVQENCRIGQALGRTGPTLRRFRTWFAAAWRTFVGLVTGGAALGAALWLTRRSALLTAALPLASLAIYVWLRASWFGWLATHRPGSQVVKKSGGFNPPRTDRWTTRDLA